MMQPLSINAIKTQDILEFIGQISSGTIERNGLVTFPISSVISLLSCMLLRFLMASNVEVFVQLRVIGLFPTVKTFKVCKNLRVSFEKLRILLFFRERL